jgi:hypothetical protein
MYSQIARPYGSGLFFSLLMLLYWTKMMLEPETKFWRNASIFIFGASLCAYNHHFSLLFAACVGLAGLFFIKKDYFWKYLVCGVIIFLLYIPHLPIFFYQLNVGGIGGADGWLQKPTFSFVTEYFKYVFNFSKPSLFLALALCCCGFIQWKTSQLSLKKVSLFIFLFATPFAIGYFYSVYVNSVLQASVLIFSFPVLFLLLFVSVNDLKPKFNFIIVFVILFVNSYALIFERKNYSITYEGMRTVFDDMEFMNSRQKMNVVIQTQNSSALFLSKRAKMKTKFINIDQKTNVNDFKLLVEKQQEDKLMVVFTSEFDANYLSSIVAKYPVLRWQKNYSNFTSFIFSRKGKTITSKSVLNVTFDKKKKFPYTTNNFDYSSMVNGKYQILQDQEWCPSFEIPLRKYLKTGLIAVTGKEFLHISIDIKTSDSLSNPLLVGNLLVGDSSYHWSANDFKYGNYDKTGVFKTIHLFIKLQNTILDKNLVLETSVWNRDKRPITLDNLKVEVWKGNPIVYGWIQEF